MPIYEFVCPNCGYEFELIRSFSDASTPVCPQCANEEVNRQVGRPAIHFKGSGWYINDSKKAAKTSANGTESSSEDKSGSGDASKPAKEKSGETTTTDATKSANPPRESKPAAKPPAKEQA